ncbi:LysM peptidoglycan-binding domain-containing protein [uncultured Thiocystis sp.]|jgi:membrane-bound lytic murein transglycosylase D|uniref:LysM peptidoglycan-binding domain-containing protein n=1 Tax=uncultured Thiocystis sp. TaxID=1202134 RepID=UPI0025CF8281|nr:LysM peptidoglycan-binding domain-containing protein [uncultured Thiocystis sp.]
MPDARLLGRASCALVALALPLLNGCARQPDVTAFNNFDGAYSGMVSAREYGFVRPAEDVLVAGKSKSRVANRLPTGDVWSRVRSGMQMNLHADSRIDSTLERFRRDPRYLEKMSQQATPYLPTIVAEIERRGFPMELALLPHVESRYNPAATSPKAAGGMWQFMPYTAREMGLRMDNGYDERRDVVASTRAAMDYLDQLSRRFDGDWELAMAAYNCGPGRVEAALEANRRNGKPTDFWSLNLPNETKQYVPQILATARLVADSRKYGQRLPVIADRPRTEMLLTSTPMNLVKVAIAAGVDFAEIQRLNPEIKSKSLGQNIAQLMVPAGTGAKLKPSSANVVRVMPMTVGAADSSRTAVRLRQREPAVANVNLVDDKVHQVKNGETLTSIALRHGIARDNLADWNGLSPREPLLPGQTLRIPKQEDQNLVTHWVRKGDSIETIARRYGVTVTELRRWNRITDNRLKQGEKLRIYRS